MKKIDYNKGLRTETMSIDKFNKRHVPGGMPEITGVNTVTIYSLEPITERNYCPKHQGVVKIDGEILEWTEECDCV